MGGASIESSIRFATQSEIGEIRWIGYSGVPVNRGRRRGTRSAPYLKGEDAAPENSNLAVWRLHVWCNYDESSYNLNGTLMPGQRPRSNADLRRGKWQNSLK